VVASFLPLALRCRRSGDARLARHAVALAGLLLVQLGLGAATVLGHKAVLPTTAHVATGAAVLGGVWLLTLRAHRLLRPITDPLAARAARREPAAA
jgi:heme A synthase